MLRAISITVLALAILARQTQAGPAGHTPLTYGQWSAKTGSTDRGLYDAYDTKVRAREQRLKTASGQRVAVAAASPQTAGDVLKTTWDSFSQVGCVGFAWTFASQCRQKLPLAEGALAARKAGTRWGLISAGFSGGAAAAAVVLHRPKEDKYCAMVGSALGGLAAATSIDQIPSSVATFVGFSFLMSMLTDKAGDAGNAEVVAKPKRT